jgi:hypothetical protein
MSSRVSRLRGTPSTVFPVVTGRDTLAYIRTKPGGRAAREASAFSRRQELAPGAYLSHWCAGWCVSDPTLLLGERGDQLAAEGWDVGDHAAPDRVKQVLKASRARLRRPSREVPRAYVFPAGVGAGVNPEAREEAENESHRRPRPWEILDSVNNLVRVHRAREDGMLGVLLDIVPLVAARDRY